MINLFLCYDASVTQLPMFFGWKGDDRCFGMNRQLSFTFIILEHYRLGKRIFSMIKIKLIY